MAQEHRTDPPMSQAQLIAVGAVVLAMALLVAGVVGLAVRGDDARAGDGGSSRWAEIPAPAPRRVPPTTTSTSTTTTTIPPSSVERYTNASAIDSTPAAFPTRGVSGAPAPQWSADLPGGTVRTDASASHVFVAIRDGSTTVVRAYARASGELMWAVPIAEAIPYDLLAVDGDALVVARLDADDRASVILRLNGRSGEEVWRTDHDVAVPSFEHLARDVLMIGDHVGATSLTPLDLTTGAVGTRLDGGAFGVGHRLLSHSDDGQVSVYDIATMQRVLGPIPGSGELAPVTNGIVALSDSRIDLVDATGKIVASVLAPAEGPSGIDAIGPSRVAVRSRNGAWIYDTAGSQLTLVVEIVGTVRSLRAGDRTIIAAQLGTTVSLYDAGTPVPALLGTIESGADSVEISADVVYSADPERGTWAAHRLDPVTSLGGFGELHGTIDAVDRGVLVVVDGGVDAWLGPDRSRIQLYE